MQRQGLEPAKRVAYFEYDFARDGGAVGDIAMRGDSLPEGAIVTSGMVHVVDDIATQIIQATLIFVPAQITLHPIVVAPVVLIHDSILHKRTYRKHPETASSCIFAEKAGWIG